MTLGGVIGRRGGLCFDEHDKSLDDQTSVFHRLTLDQFCLFCVSMSVNFIF